MPSFKKDGQRKLSRREISRNRLENFKKEIETDLHTIPLQSLFAQLDSHQQFGLNHEKAKKLLEDHGPNALTPSRKTPEIIKFLKLLSGGFSILLWIGAFLCFGSALVRFLHNENYQDELVLGIVLCSIVIVTGMFMYYQENKSSKIMESFGNMIPMKATVIRQGESIQILARDVVVGDLVEIKGGDTIPADIRIIKNQGLKVDHSAITGESEPLPRSTESTSEQLYESRNVALFSTNAIEGTAIGVVIACGDNTVMGHIAGLAVRLQADKTPIAKEMERFMKIISVWALFLGFVFGIASLCLGYSWLEAALFLIGIIVANVPEGLLATVTVCLSVTAKRMAARNCLVKNLEAVETLGSVSVICSDKTGTLTQNRMTVLHVWFNKKQLEVDVQKNEIIKGTKSDEGFSNLMRCVALCNRAEFKPQQEHLNVLRKEVRGDASEAALLKFAELSGSFGSVMTFRDQNPKLFEIPFTSATKFQASLHALDNGNEMLLVVKGAPEGVLDRCNKILLDGKTETLDDNVRTQCEHACMNLAAKGERVLGFADLVLEGRYNRSFHFSTDPPNFPLVGLRFLGFVSLIDPPRPQVTDAVAKCRSAGIRIIMVTGDHPVTAKAIAESVGIITSNNTIDDIHKRKQASDSAIVIDGTKLRSLSSDEVDEILYSFQEIVFARTSPQQKLQIVEGCQRLGETVAVTGDGVNDSPALKKADIGIAMGIAGTEVSHQSADMILLDDNFASIITGIEEGRRIFDNLKKSICYTLASNVPEILPFIAFVSLDIPLPLGVIAILCIDLLTDMMPAISLAYEKAESDIMMRPPRNPAEDHMVTGKLYYLAYGHLGMIEAAGGFFVYFMIMAEHGFLPMKLFGLREKWESEDINDLEDSYGQEWSYSERKVLEYTCYSAVMVSVVVSQWFDLIVCKTRRNSLFKQGMGNWILNISLIVETLLTCILCYTPGMYYLKFYPVHIRGWLYALPFIRSTSWYTEIITKIKNQAYDTRNGIKWKTETIGYLPDIRNAR
ncbi:sodium/potassium-transporting ATPase subunit alpha [Agrilus planipennis]|uniref:Sodium/potassium-transporting ATPase subunit alpha n=1 Tax=Agrilus planipennis TaxID=224129 RepID=A0A7F5R7T6_AGRPL|nr:sodium/potassium-transporting ATPase subunit alpha [Agrilus planipennis]